MQRLDPLGHFYTMFNADKVIMPIIIVLGIVGMLMILVSTQVDTIWNGLLFQTPDSVQYMAAALNVLGGDGFVRYEGGSFTAWPPLYPIIVAALTNVSRLISVEPIATLRMLHAIIYGLIIIMTGYILKLYLNSKLLVILGTITVMVSVPVLEISVYIWSEQLFVLFNLFFLLVLRRLLLSLSPRWLILTIFLSVLTWLHRYLGVSVIVTGVIAIVFFAQTHKWKNRLIYAISYGVLSSVPIGLWFLRNHNLIGRFRVPRDSTSAPVKTHVLHSLTTISKWFVPSSFDYYFEHIFRFTALFLILAIVIFFIWFKRHNLSQSKLINQSQSSFPVITGLYALVYVVTLIISVSLTFLTPVGNRYLSPSMIPLMMVVLFVLNAATRSTKSRQWLIGGVMITWLILYPVPKAIDYVDIWHNSASDMPWMNSDMIAWVKDAEIDERIFANTPIPLYRAIEVQEVRRRVDQWSDTVLPNEEFFLMWFNEVYRNFCAPRTRCYRAEYDVVELESLMSLERIAEFDEGDVYRAQMRVTSDQSGERNRIRNGLHDMRIMATIRLRIR